MAERTQGDKINRILSIYTDLLNGHVLSKTALSEQYGVNERSIQRDISDIRNFLENAELNEYHNSIEYDPVRGGYRLQNLYGAKLSNEEILATCKILLDSRAFTKKEMVSLLKKMIAGCVPKSNQKMVEDLVKNEEYHYIEPHHKKVFIDKLWVIANAVRKQNFLEIQYTRIKGNETVKRRVKPVGIMFSEFYFYMCAFIDDPDVQMRFENLNDANPTIYRVDRIDKVRVLDEHFKIPYSDRFEEGEFRKRVQFMFGGKLRRVKFRYTGMSIESVLDRLPTAKAVRDKDGTYIVTAEVYGNGIDLWMKGQGDSVEEFKEGM